jgi:hypothetical protein
LSEHTVKRAGGAGASPPIEVGRARVGLFLFGCRDLGALAEWLARIPEPLEGRLDEIVVMLARPPEAPLPAPSTLLGGRQLPLRFHRPPRESGPGEIRKAAFEYALSTPLTHVIVARVDAAHPPEVLGALLDLVAAAPRSTLLVTRRDRGAGLVGLRHRVLGWAQNRILGMRIADYHTALRAYPVEALRRIPFQLDADDEQMDAELLVQLRCLGAPIHEADLLDGRPGSGSTRPT